MSRYKCTIALIFISLLFITLLSPKFLPQTKMPHSQYDTVSQWLHVSLNPNGSLTRPIQFFPTIPPSFSSSSLSLSKDLTLNPKHHTRIRLYLPRIPLDASDPNPTRKKLPILVFVHGGGFILCSVGTPVIHEFCNVAASQLGALVVSVDYQLAPEHRLPAPFDNVLEALTWVKDGKDEWVRNYGDLSTCVLAGESAGGNIVFNAGLRVAAKISDFQPLVIKGLVLIQPYFGGSKLTGSELRLVADPVLPLHVNEFMWELALPVGANRSHEFCDPIGNVGSGLDRVRDLGWWVGVIASGGDPLYDRDMGLIQVMEEKGLKVKSMVTKDDRHGVFVSDASHKRKDLLDLVRSFF